MDDLGRTGRQRFGESRRCQATNKNGQRCGRWAIPGGFVCVNHGGKAPATIAAARERLATFIDPALSAIIRALEGGPRCEVCGRSDDDLDPTRLKAAITVLDRAGLPPMTRVQHSLRGGRPGDDELAAQLAAMSNAELLQTNRELTQAIIALMEAAGETVPGEQGERVLRLLPAIDAEVVPAPSPASE
jgi:hypothetical protein